MATFMDAEDVVSCFCLNAFGYYYYSDSDDENSRSMSPVSNSEERECRICQLELGSSYGQGLVELGCSCKDDLAFAHRQCAETWFTLKGDEVCEICHSVARNVTGGNEKIEEEEEVVVVVGEEEGGGGGGNATVGEDRESFCLKRRLVLIIVLIIWLSPFLIYFLQSEH